LPQQLCKLYFSTNSINDAVAQLERHIKTFRRVLGMAEKEFEHWAWLSRQCVPSLPCCCYASRNRQADTPFVCTRYEVFAQLLEQHPQTIDVENKKCFPGYYYHVCAIRLVLSTSNELILAPVVCSLLFQGGRHLRQ
jgi:hypothetical protein